MRKQSFKQGKCEISVYKAWTPSRDGTPKEVFFTRIGGDTYIVTDAGKLEMPVYGTRLFPTEELAGAAVVAVWCAKLSASTEEKTHIPVKAYLTSDPGIFRKVCSDHFSSFQGAGPFDTEIEALTFCIKENLARVEVLKEAQAAVEELIEAQRQQQKKLLEESIVSNAREE